MEETAEDGALSTSTNASLEFCWMILLVGLSVKFIINLKSIQEQFGQIRFEAFKPDQAGSSQQFVVLPLD